MKRPFGLLISPVIYEWPVLLAWIILVGWSSLLQNPFYRWFIIFFHAYIVATLIYLTYSRIIKMLVYVMMFTLFTIETTLESCYDLTISPSTLLLAVETSPQEAYEFFENLVKKPLFWVTMALIVVFYLSAHWAERHRFKVANKLKHPKIAQIISYLSTILLTVGIITSNCYISLFRCKTTDEVSEWNQHMRHPSDAMTRVVIAFFDTHISNIEMDKAIRSAENIEVGKAADDDSVHVVFVIGESFIRHHSPIYGYAINTTPFMLSEHQEGRLIAFSDVVSPYNFTTHVIRNMLSCNSLDAKESWSQKPPLTAVFKANDYRVEMYDNQKTFSQAATFSYALNTYLYHPKMSGLCYDETNDKTFAYDGDLVNYYQQQHHGQRTHSLTIFHLMGQHLQAHKRYPPEKRFMYFTSDSIPRNEQWITKDMKKEIAYYDNATLYNDYVIQKITNIFKNENAVIVYLSDHGEEVYDYRNNMGRSGGVDKKNLVEYARCQYCVPLIVWYSDHYLAKHPDIVEQLKKASNRPMMTDNICHMLFHLAGLTQIPYYNPMRDVLSNNYVCGKRIINDKYDYDKIKTNNYKR